MHWHALQVSLVVVWLMPFRHEEQKKDFRKHFKRIVFVPFNLALMSSHSDSKVTLIIIIAINEPLSMDESYNMDNGFSSKDAHFHIFALSATLTSPVHTVPMGRWK